MSQHRPFEIWVELEAITDGTWKEDVEDQYCNAIIEFENGDRIGLNIWSEALFNRCPTELFWYDNKIADGPDLIIKDFSIESIKATLSQLITEDNWLIGRGFPANDESDNFTHETQVAG
ncbi:hypothetical protein [Gimesia sp.]|uniref:hypothetical protein n=1 Tax=Gimesia sp. TaxID=2024833 RepID=UPI0032ED5FC1